MSIRTGLNLIAAALVGVVAGAVLVTFRLTESQQALAESEARRHQSYKLAEELRQSSNDLTRMARTYAVTGDPRYEAWFRSILAIRNGEEPRAEGYDSTYWDLVISRDGRIGAVGEAVSLEELMRRIEFTDEELALLREAQGRSDALVALEDRAMAAVKGLYPDAEGEYTVRGEPDLALARELLHGEAYHDAKGFIMEPIGEFLDRVDARTQADLVRLRERDRALARTALALALAAGALLAAALVLLQRRVVRPVTELARLVGHVERGDYAQRLPVRGRDEVASLSNAFNLMSASIERDVAESERMTAELERSEAKYRRIFETTADGYVLSRLDDARIIDVNPAAARILGYPNVEALEGLRTSDLYAKPEDRERIVGPLREQNEFSDLEVDLVRMDGTPVSLMLSGRILPDEGGTPTWLEASFFDVTPQKEAQAALEDARRAAEEASQAKSAFLANMSHELRTPMNAIIGYSEMLHEDAHDDGNEEVAADLEKIQRAAKHLLALINDVLDLSKIEAGRMDLHLETFEIPAMIEEVVSTVGALVDAKRNTLQVEVDPELGSMRADLTKVRQSLFNLLSNAAKFTQDGEIRLVARKEIVDGAEWIQISVRDTGIGIAPDALAKVFEEFSQAEEGTTRDYGGTGLGLSITQRFCRMMGGEILVESTPGEGSTFTLRLPMRVTPGAAAGTAADEASLLGEAPPTEASRPDGERTVLVIDDDPNALELLGRSLQAEGFRVVTASDGREAVKLARTLRPAAITLDVVMPGMDGWEVLRELKEAPETWEIPVVMVTMTDDRETGYSLGATEFLTKPVDRGRLAALLGRVGAGAEARSRHALVVDDLAENRVMLRQVLEQQGWRVSEAENGQRALEALQTERPSLILLDLMMPVMDGFAFVLETRKDPVLREIPIVVVTAKDVSEAERRQLSGDVVSLIERGGTEQESLLEHIRRQVTAVSESADA